MKTDPEHSRHSTNIHNEQLRLGASFATNVGVIFIIGGLLPPLFLNQHLGWMTVGCLAAGAAGFGVGSWLLRFLNLEDP